VNERIVIQGVHMVVDTSALGAWGNRPRRTQLVFIGRELDHASLRQGFDACLQGGTEGAAGGAVDGGG
jgi:G3E family GTPase